MNASASVGVEQAARAEFGAGLRRFRTCRHLSLDEMGRLLGVSGNYVYTMERGVHAASGVVREKFSAIAQAADIFSVSMAADGTEHDVPMVSWAQAGRATCYEEMPLDWLDPTRSTCPDRQAFAIRLRGDSMEPHHREGEVVVAMPNHPPHSGCLVLACLAEDYSVIFKRFTVAKRRPYRFKLSSYNRAYPAREYTWDQVHWVYPVFAAERLANAKGCR